LKEDWDGAPMDHEMKERLGIKKISIQGSTSGFTIYREHKIKNNK